MIALAGSQTDAWNRVVMGMGKAVWTLDGEENGHLVEMGVKMFDGDGLPASFG